MALDQCVGINHHLEREWDSGLAELGCIVWSSVLDAIHQATTLLPWKASFHHCSLASGSSPRASRSHRSCSLVLGQEQLVPIYRSKAIPSCFSWFLEVLWSKLVWGRNRSHTKRQDTVTQQEAFGTVGGLVGYILLPQETVLLLNLGLCPHPKYVFRIEVLENIQMQHKVS